MLQVSYLFLKELALLLTEIYAGVSEPLEHFLQAEQVLLERVANNDQDV
jgi:hypothetical protein